MLKNLTTLLGSFAVISISFSATAINSEGTPSSSDKDKTVCTFRWMNQTVAQALSANTPNSCSCIEYSCNNTQLSSWSSTVNTWTHENDGKADIGASWGSRSAIASKTISDGAWVLDAENIYQSNLPPSSFTAQLTSPSIDISCFGASTIFFSFHQYFRSYSQTTSVDYSLDNGTTWISRPINTNVPAHSETSNYDYQIIAINIGSPSPSNSNILFRFNYQGYGYFWIIDDIKVCGQYPSPTRPTQYLGEYIHANVSGFTTYQDNNPSYKVDMHGHAYKPNQVVVKLDSIGPADTLALSNGDTMIIVDTCDCDTLAVYEYKHKPSAGSYPSSTGKSMSIEETVRGAKATTRVRDAEPNYYVYNDLSGRGICRGPSDMPISSLSAFSNLPSTPSTTPYKVAILDTGIDPTSVDLAQSIYIHGSAALSNMRSAIGANIINQNNNPLDDHGHGSHVAGILRSSINTLIASTCGSDMKFDIYKTHDHLGLSTLFHSTCGLYCATEADAKVINCSWGYYASDFEEAVFMYDAIQKAHLNHSYIIASAGNDSIEVDTPHLHFPSSFTFHHLPNGLANLPNIVSVGSCDNSGEASLFSNFSNDYVDVASNGESVQSHLLCGTMGNKSGTSMSAPIVSAAVANKIYCTVFSTGTPILESILNHCAFPSTLPSTSDMAVLGACCHHEVSITGADTVCLDTSIVLTAVGGGTYSWSTGNTTESINISSGGSYMVTATLSNGCKAVDAKTVIGSTCISFDPLQNCNTYTLPNVNGNQWLFVNDMRGHRVVAIHPHGQFLGNVRVSIRNFLMPPVVNCSDALLPRHLDIDCAHPGPFAHPVSVRLYYYNSELNDYIDAMAMAGCGEIDPLSLAIYHYDGINEDCDPSNNDPVFNEIAQREIIWHPLGTEGFYLQADVTSFSEFGVFGTTSSSLPVELRSFDGIVEGEAIRLNWVTETEHNNDYFAIERSSGSDGFIEIGTKTGALSTTEPQQYSFVDTRPTGGMNYYRLRSVDLNGSSTFSQVIALDFSKELAFSTLANPFKGVANLRISSLVHQQASIAVFDFSGNKVGIWPAILNKGQTNVDIDLSALPNAIYVFKLTTEDGFSQSITMQKSN